MNKDLFFDGEKFISARRAAQEVGYAEDYVGQLCRDGKLPSRMVGRSWYVSRKAILAHKKNGSQKSSIRAAIDRASAPGSKDLFFNGQRYLSSARAAKAVGYANDYIGQLCRSGALDCRMVGRSWYVSRQAILAHKKSRKPKENKILVAPAKIKKVSPAKVSVSRAIRTSKPNQKIETNEKKISYAAGSVLAFPELAHPRAKLVEAQSGLLKLVATAMSVAVIALVFFGWLGYASPAEYASVKVSAGTLEASAIGAGGDFFGYIGANISTGGRELVLAVEHVFGATPAAAPTAPDLSSQSIVAMPDATTTAGHEELVNKVKDEFSDPVDVKVDPDGNSGVITPVFHDGDDSTNYAFVMVPVSTATTTAQ